MATIRRHPLPPDSFQPDAPLNDLGREQLNHFIHVAERLPPELRVDMPIPSPEDGHAANRFIAAVTERLMSRKPPALKVVAKRHRKPASSGISIAAGAEEAHPQRAKSKSTSTSTSKSKSKSKARKHSPKKSPRE
jgi:hypothetical protein